MSHSILFLVNGLGLGNSTRCHAIIEKMLDRGSKVHVITSGNGLEYFRNNSRLSSLHSTTPLYYSGTKDRVSGWSTLSSTPELYRLLRAKNELLEGLLHRIKPDIVVSDSEYTIKPVRKCGIPLVGINNADVVVDEYFGSNGLPKRDFRGQFWTVEYLDYLYHRFNYDLVISPSAVNTPPRHSRIRRIGLIIRKSVQQLVKAADKPFIPPRMVKSAVFMLSGSIFASTILPEDPALPYKIDIVGRSGPNHGQITYHGKLMDNCWLLDKADMLVINGGFSAVSEALALNKPTLVIPVPGHAEQMMNAHMMQRLGRGLITTPDQVFPLLQRCYQSNRWENLPIRQEVCGIDGASEAAELIDRLLTTKVAPSYRGVQKPSHDILT